MENKLNKKEKIITIFYIILSIFYVFVSIKTKNIAWFCCGLLWLLILFMEILYSEIIRNQEDLIKEQNNFIEKNILNLKNNNTK